MRGLAVCEVVLVAATRMGECPLVNYMTGFTDYMILM